MFSIKHCYSPTLTKLQLQKIKEAVFIPYVMFTNDCYRFYDDQNMPRFDDRNHRHLFDFVNAELPQIETLLENFFSAMFDFQKLKLKKDRPRYKEYEEEVQFTPVHSIEKPENDLANVYLKEIISILESSHPFFRIGENARNAAKDAIIDYFHLHSSYNEVPHNEEDYKENVIKLLSTPPLLPYYPESDEVTKFYQDYKKCYDQSASIRRALQKGRQVETKYSINIIAVQQRMKELLWRILDISEPIINKLTIFDRIWLYKKLQSKKPFSSADVQKLSTCPAISDFITAYPLHDNLHYEFAPKGNIKLTIFEDENKVYEQLVVESLEQLLQWEFIKMVEAGAKIKKCACCGRYFLVKDGKNNYCDRVFKGDKTCLDVGSNHRFKEKKKNDAYYTAYRKAISRNQARVNSKTKEKQLSEYSFKYWREEAKRKRAEVYDDKEKRIGSFLGWLDMTSTEIVEKFEEEFKYLCEVYADEEKRIEIFFEWWDMTDKRIIVEKFKYWCSEVYADGEKSSKSFFEWLKMANKEF